MSLHFLIKPSACEEEQPLTCPLCESELFVTDLYNGEDVCVDCGCVVNSASVNRGVDAHFYEENGVDEKRRYGAWSLQSSHDKGMNTYMSGDRDFYGSPLPKNKVEEIRRIQRQNVISKMDDSTARNLSVAMSEVDRICTGLHLPLYVKEYAAKMYRQALTCDLIRGRSIDAFVAASVYLACRMLSIPRSLKTVTAESKRDYQEVSMTYRFMLKKLSMKPPVDDPMKFIPRLASELDVSRGSEMLAIDILQEAKEKRELMGKDPRGMAAAALYLALELNDERVVQRLIADAADTTEVTLRNRYRGLKDVLGYE